MTTDSHQPREITSEVLLKLRTQDTLNLPVACRTCPAALWQTTGKPSRPDQLQVRCYCRIMHTFTWDKGTKEEILDCDLLYDQEDEEEELETEEDLSSLPPYLREQREKARQAQEEEVSDPLDGLSLAEEVSS